MVKLKKDALVRFFKRHLNDLPMDYTTAEQNMSVYFAMWYFAFAFQAPALSPSNTVVVLMTCSGSSPYSTLRGGFKF